MQTVQQRGAAVIQARKLSSAMSAAKATCDHLRDWWNGTKEVERLFLLRLLLTWILFRFGIVSLEIVQLY